MDNKEILEKLRNLNDLLAQFTQQHDYYENGCASESLDRIEQVKAAVSVLPGVPSIANAMPVFPVGEREYQKAKGETVQSGKITTIALVATVASLGLWLITKATFLAIVGVIAGIAWYVLNKNHQNNKQGLAKKEKVYNESVAACKNSVEKFRKALTCYEQEVADGIVAAKAFGQLYRQKREEHSAILVEFAENKNAALDRCNELVAQIEQHDYIPQEYYHHIPKLISLLQSGRADSYKEALNIAIEEERQEAMEKARQEEEARRLAAMERQAEEERRHNMMLERQQAAHDRAMERAAKEQADAQRREALQAKRDQERAAREAHEKEMDARQKAQHRCSKCSKRFACSVRGNPNCGAFEPDAIFKH